MFRAMDIFKFLIKARAGWKFSTVYSQACKYWILKPIFHTLFLSVSRDCNWANSALKHKVCPSVGRTEFPSCFLVWLFGTWLLHPEHSNVNELLREVISTPLILTFFNLQFLQLFLIFEMTKDHFLMIKKNIRHGTLWDEILPLLKRMANSMI